MTDIQINISDDFYEDDYIPTGKIQSTYMYIESSELDIDNVEKCLLHIKKYIEDYKLLPDSVVTIKYYDSAIDYPKLAIEMPSMMFKRFELNLTPITHRQLDILLENLRNANLTYNDKNIYFYSES